MKPEEHANEPVTNMLQSWPTAGATQQKRGAFHYLLKLKQLSATHRQQREQIVSDTELFVLGHEWTNWSYDRKDVTNMIKYQLTKIDTLLEEEKEACERAEAETPCKNKLEDEAFR
ncbi:hypothetical protein GCK32_013845 [Trichostrongylus colubriformis]|uniref:Uncharacterized protein n=1 Tax=Trichostrongylus colubriformis TaxID=6319 RepID=A0AAN8J1W7_TRICO